ncbi:hypothetical protein Tco_0815310 [Tanacetum coccineum]
MKLLMTKCLNSTKYMEALRNAFGLAIEKGMQEGLAAGIEHEKVGRCLSDLEAYNLSAEADFNSAVHDLCGLDFLLLRELSAKKDASTWDVMDLLRLDDAVAETSTEPLVTALITTALSTVVIRPNSDPFLLVEDYENPDLAGAVLEDVIPWPDGEGKVGGSTEGDVDVGDLVFYQLENEARDAVL